MSLSTATSSPPLARWDGRGKEEIRADGLAVTPGFIDLHTHLDAQIGWDPMLTPHLLAWRHHRPARQLRRHVRALQACG